MTSFLSCFVSLQEAWWPSGEYCKLHGGQSMTILTSTHTGLYGVKNFIQNNVFAFL